MGSDSAEVDSGPGGDRYDPSAPSGWYADPLGRGEHRFWDGSSWTDHVSTAGVVSQSPLKMGSLGRLKWFMLGLVSPLVVKFVVFAWLRVVFWFLYDFIE